MRSHQFHDEEYEVYFLIAGERYYFIGDRTFHVQKGDLILINTNELHKTSDVVPDHERIMFRFKREFLLSPSSSVDEALGFLFNESHHVNRFPEEEQKTTKSFILKIVQEAKMQELGFEANIQALITQLLIFVGRYNQKNEAYSFEHPSPLHHKASEIVKYINSHYTEELTLSGLSKQFYISPFYLTRLFKEATGFTFVEYLNNLRIKEAQRLLRESQWKISRIAEQSGFGSVAHFQRIFKRFTGMTPLHYRKATAG